jgi:hypothetical protein
VTSSNFARTFEFGPEGVLIDRESLHPRRKNGTLRLEVANITTPLLEDFVATPRTFHAAFGEMPTPQGSVPLVLIHHVLHAIE